MIPRYWQEIQVDIAERKEEALKESERRFATVLANARAYVYRCRNEEGYPNEFTSDYTLELTGYPPEDLLVGGQVRFGDLIVEEDRERVWEEVQEALAGGALRAEVFHKAQGRGAAARGGVWAPYPLQRREPGLLHRAFTLLGGASFRLNQ